MRALAVVSLFAGIAIGVLVSFFGLERRRGPQVRVPHPALNAGSFAPSLIAWGAVTYVLERTGWMGSTANALVGLAAAAAAWAGMSTLLARWALREDVARAAAATEAAEALLGHIATVVRAIEPNERGEISYRLDGRQHALPARSLDDTAIPAGAEVVIERVEDDVAYVEKWSEVERRL